MPHIEWLGTAMSVIVAVSLLQKNIKWLRILNLIGSAGFSAYGIMIMAWPVAGLNGFIALVNAFYLIEMIVKKDSFSHIFISPREDTYCLAFTIYYKKDMEQFQPLDGFPDDSRACVIMRNMVPVSLVVFRITAPHKAEILLDYATPQYRDFKSAKYFQQRVVGDGELKNICQLTAHSSSKAHSRYLERMGFKPASEGDNCYEWNIS